MDNPEELSEIIAGSLFLSSVHCRTSGGNVSLLQHNIDTVYDISGMKWLEQLPNIRYCVYPNIADSTTQVLRPTMDHIYNDYKSLLAQNPDCKVLVHCQQGISRSAAVVIYICMRLSGVRLKEAFLEVKQKRRVVLPNAGFMSELVEAERELYGETSLEIGKHGQLLWKL
jgi:protein-tyrosine phosphatase